MNKKIAVIVERLDETYQSNILSGIYEAAGKYNFDCYVFVSFTGMKNNKGHDAGEMNIFSLPDFKNFDGAILLTNTIGCPPVVEDILKRISDAGIPAVSMDNDVDGMLHIGIDNYSAMGEITEHFITEHGFTDFCYISGPSKNPESYSRLAAFCDVLARHGIEIADNSIYYGDFRGESGMEAAEFFIKKRSRMPQVIICANDVMAAAAVNRLHSEGIRIPEDVAVSGFDDIYDSLNLRVELTTVSRPLVHSGALACEMLNNVFNNKQQQKSVIMNMSPKYSESCGCVGHTYCDAADYKEANIANYIRIDSNNRYMSIFNSLACELNGAEDFKGYINSLKKFVKFINPEEFYFCLNEKWNYVSHEITGVISGKDKIPSVYEKNITVPIAYCRGRFSEYEHINVNELLPSVKGRADTVKYYYFLPLHFKERCLGYMAIHNCGMSLHNTLFQAWCITINNSLENIRKIMALDDAVENLKRLYIQDTFSGIYNRNGFVNATNEVFRDCSVNSRNIMLMFIDLDGLKKINDTYGHAAGDEAIRAIAHILHETCVNGEIFCRFGGDEFIVFAADYTDDDAQHLTARIQKNISRYNKQSKLNLDKYSEYRLSASTGYVIAIPKIGEDLFRFVTEADKKMYETKREKKSKYLRG